MAIQCFIMVASIYPTEKSLEKAIKKQLKKSVEQAAKNKKAIKLLKKQLSAFEAKSMSYLERLFMSNVDYPIDDFGAIAYVDASYSDTGRFGSIGIVMLTRSEVIQYSEIPENLEDCALTSTNHELLAAAKQFKWPKKDILKISLLSMIIILSLKWLKVIL